MADTITVNNREYEVEIEPDFDAGPPWKEADGHIEIFERRPNPYTTPHVRFNKAPSERILYVDNRTAWVYDFADAVKKARREGWAADAHDLEAFNGGEITRGTIAVRAVEADADRMRQYLAGVWDYVVVIVRRADDCPECGDSAVLGSVESDYIEETARELALELAP